MVAQIYHRNEATICSLQKQEKAICEAVSECARDKSAVKDEMAAPAAEIVVFSTWGQHFSKVSRHPAPEETAVWCLNSSRTVRRAWKARVQQSVNGGPHLGHFGSLGLKSVQPGGGRGGGRRKGRGGGPAGPVLHN